MPNFVSSSSVTVDRVSAFALQIKQGSDQRSVINQDSQFATDQPEAVILQGPSPVFASILQAGGHPDAIRWQLDRDPSEADPTPPPALSNTTGPEVSFQASTVGNFRLIAYVDRNNNQVFDQGEQLFVMRFAIVRIRVQGAENFRVDALLLRTGRLDAPAAGMSLDAIYLVEGGGANRTIGTNRIGIGNVGNAIADTFRVDYPPTPYDGRPGTAFSRPENLPMLDSQRRPPQPPGQSAFRSNSLATAVSGPTPGIYIRVSSRDNPRFVWADPHPATGNPVGSLSGGYEFREFVVAFSEFFPNTYVPLFRAGWTAAPCVSARARISPSTPATPSPVVVRPPFFDPILTYSPRPSLGSGPIRSGTCPAGGGTVSNDVSDFAFGQVIADKLGRGCEVIFGELLTDSPRSGERVRVRVSRPITGSRSKGEIIEIRYAPAGACPISRDTLTNAWDHVRFALFAPVMAVLALHPTGALLPGDPVLVTSRQGDFQKIVFLTQRALLLEKSPETLDALVTSAIASPDCTLGGFLCGLIWHREAVSDPQLALSLLARMIGRPAVPPEAWRELAEDLTLLYALVSEASRHSVFARFLELAQAPDPVANMAAFHGMGKIASFSKLPAVFTDSTIDLVKTYRRLVQIDGMPRELAFETALSIEFCSKRARTDLNWISGE